MVSSRLTNTICARSRTARHLILCWKPGTASRSFAAVNQPSYWLDSEGAGHCPFLFCQKISVDSPTSPSKLHEPPSMNSKARARLVHLLISKSIIEALLIGGVAVAFFFATT